MQWAVNKVTPTFLVQSEDDLRVLQHLKARAFLVGDQIGLGDGNVVLIARGDARELLKGMNLGGTGRFIDLGPNGNLSAFLGPRLDPLACLDETAQDIFWHEERPLSYWAVPEEEPARPCGFSFLHPYLRWTLSGELVIVAGPYGCGKSTFSRLLAYDWADKIGRAEDAHVSIVGWEDKISTIKREVLRYSLGADVAELNSAQAKRLADMESRVRWTQRHPDDARLLQWYCDLVEHRAKHDNVRFFVFDPFNEHDSTRAPNQTETEYVRDMMIKFRKLAHGLGITLVVVTHVSAKSYDENGKIKPFRVANASGSVQFGNKCDRGICIVRTSALKERASTAADEHMLLHFDKFKNEEVMGRRGTVACVLDPQSMALAEDVGATAAAREMWRT